MGTDLNWDDEVDVVVVGFGGAGACAAIEAADNGSSVMVIERFSGGGASKASGGIVYAGGTTHQKEAGFDDTPENMFNYLKMEVKDAVKDDIKKIEEQIIQLQKKKDDIKMISTQC